MLNLRKGRRSVSSSWLLLVDCNNNNNNNIYFRTSCKYYTNIVYKLSSQNYMLA